MKKSIKCSILALCFIALGIINILLFSNGSTSGSGWEYTKATVTSNNPTTGVGTGMHFLNVDSSRIIYYVYDVDGVTYTGISRVPNVLFSVGSEIDIQYRPKNPAISVVVSVVTENENCL